MTTSETVHPEFDSEREFLEHAAACLDALREELPRDGDAGGDPKAAAALKKHLAKVPFRDGGELPVFGQIDRDELTAEAVRRAQSAHASGGTAAIIAPETVMAPLRSELEASGLEFGDAERGELASTVELLDPSASKGLEFDHVVVVEPAAIIREAKGGDGHRDLYVALTRATRTLTCLHAEPLPWPLGDQSLPAPAGMASVSSFEPVREPAPTRATEPPVGSEISVGEALVLARMRGMDLAEALARGLLAVAVGGSDAEAAWSILDPNVHADDVKALLEQLRAANGPISSHGQSEPIVTSTTTAATASDQNFSPRIGAME